MNKLLLLVSLLGFTTIGEAKTTRHRSAEEISTTQIEGIVLSTARVVNRKQDEIVIHTSRDMNSFVMTYFQNKGYKVLRHSDEILIFSYKNAREVLKLDSSMSDEAAIIVLVIGVIVVLLMTHA